MIRRLLAAAVCLALIATPTALAAGHKKKPKGFTPKSIAGTWSGNWNNQTFGSTGTVTLSTKLLHKGKAFEFHVGLGGNALGCSPQPPERTPVISKGRGQNHWNSKGFTLHLNSPAYGEFTVKYVHKTHKLTGSGGHPPCAPGVSWALDGKLTHAAFTGNVSIDLGNGQKASSTLTVNRK
jgi:hypothetical protein